MEINVPQLHYHSDDWMNDPIPFYWNGEYHIFYQYKTPRQWGHVRSKDLIRWEELPVAIAPEDDALDGGGCYTGCCIFANEQFHLFYPGVQKGMGYQTICHAVSDDLIHWRKSPHNPLIKPGLPYAEKGAWRDPFIWHEDGCWHMLLSAEIPDKPRFAKGCVAYLRSSNLFDWEICDPVYVSDGMINCECPDVFPVGDRYAMFISGGVTVVRYGSTMLGPFSAEEGVQYRDEMCYAVKTLQDDQDRRYAWGFISEPWGWAHGERPSYQSWSGCLSFPREIAADKHDRLVMRFPEAFEQLRVREWFPGIKGVLGRWMQTTDSVTCTSTPDYALARFNDVQGSCLEVQVKIRLESAARAGVIVRWTDDAKEIVGIFLDRDTNTLRIEELAYGLETANSGKWKPRVQTTLRDSVTEDVHLRILLDGSIIEVCANDHTVLTGRTYAESPDAVHTGLFAVGGSARFMELQCWELGLDGKSFSRRGRKV